MYFSLKHSTPPGVNEKREPPGIISVFYKKGGKFQIWFKEVIQQQHKTSQIQFAMNDCKNEIQTHDNNYVDGAEWHL